MLKVDEEDARDRLRAFWYGSSLGRPALFVVAANPDYEKMRRRGKAVPHKEKDLSPKWQVWYNREYINSTVFLAEAMPGVSIHWSAYLATVPVLAGADFDYDESNTFIFLPSDKMEPLPTARIRPMPEVFDRPTPQFDPDHDLLKRQKAIIRRLAKEFGRGVYINPPTLLDSLTTLSLLRTAEQLARDLRERPDRVKIYSEALTVLGIEVYDHFYQLLLDLGYGDTSSWLNLMAEGRFEALQCDFAVEISPEDFGRFVLPDLWFLTEYFDYSLYHMDGTSQMRFLDLLNELPKLSGIQWNPEPAAGSPVEWIDAFREIKKRDFSLHLFCRTVEEAAAITRALGPDGLMIELPMFPSVEEAERAISQIEGAC